MSCQQEEQNVVRWLHVWWPGQQLELQADDGSLMYLLLCHELREWNLALEDEPSTVRRKALLSVVLLNKLLDVTVEVELPVSTSEGWGQQLQTAVLVDRLGHVR
jgi:hypothetical protein